jgi:hypothetical protein
MGNGLNSWISVLPWLTFILYFGSMPFSHGLGNLDAFLFGIALMFLFSEPPPMEDRMERAFRD